MKFTRSKKDPKKSPEEEYAEEISTLTESELRDLHKDLKIDHYGNSTAAVINTASGVGLLSIRSTTRRYRTECWQIEAMEARMKEMGWTPHPNRYRDAVPIALGVAAGTTAGMSFGLINVEKYAKRTKQYVKRKDLFKTKELVETNESDTEAEEHEVVEEIEVTESSMERTHAVDTNNEHVVVESSTARDPVPAPAAANIETENSQPEGLGTLVEITAFTEGNSAVTAVPIATEIHAPFVDAFPATTQTKTKREALFTQVSAMNKKMRSFNLKKDKEEKETTTSVTEITCDARNPVVDADADAVVSHGVAEKLDSPVFSLLRTS